MGMTKRAVARATPRHEQFVVDNAGNRKAVILPLQEYDRLLEDLHDLAVVAERRDEAPIGLAEIRRRLQEDGFL